MFGVGDAAAGFDDNPAAYRGLECSVFGAFQFFHPPFQQGFASVPCAGGYSLYADPPTATRNDDGSVDIFLPNFVDPLPLKWLHIQVTTLDALGFTVALSAGDSAGPVDIDQVFTSRTALNPFQVYGVEDWQLRPNPDWERLHIAPTDPADPTVDATGFIFGVVIDTRSVPEPATLALVGIGVAAFGYSRRRKAN